MSQFYDQASLVVVPSGYKAGTVYAQKPLTTDGQLAFTRTGDTATRVNSAGLIERVRTNLVLQSQTFDNASWLKYNATVTANTTTAPDGTTTADSLTDNANNDLHITYQSLALTAGENTISCYAKANTLSHLSIYIYDGANFFSSGIFNVSNGTVSGAGSITAAGNGWYRISFTATIATGSGNVYIALSNGSTISYAGTGQSLYIWGYQAETGVMTDYILTTSAAVSVGPVANVPRLDYTGSTCPRLILEPQRQNLITFSEQINNAAWVKTAGGTGTAPVVTANNATSPDGYQNADTVVFNAGAGTTTSDQSALYQAFTTGAGSHTASFYAKTASGTAQLLIRLNSATYEKITITNQWQRFTLTQPLTAGTNYLDIVIRRGISEPLNATATVQLWGAQVEAGAYATSYIPTLAASATRGADACSKTGISSLIGQTEGAFYCEVDMQNLDKNPQQLLELNQDANNRFGIAAFWDSFASVNRMQLYQFFGGSLEVNIQETITSGVLKVAAAYKANDYVLYINGVQIGTDTSASVPATSTIYLGSNGSAFFVGNGVKQTLLFKTRLTNAQLAELTTL